MRVFMEETKGTFQEIIRDFEIKDKKLRDVLMEILKLSLPTEEGFEYVALIRPDGWLEIRNLQNRKSCDPFNQGDKQEIGRNIGFFATAFWTNQMKSDEICRFIIEQIFLTLIEYQERYTAETALMYWALLRR
jgi:hypothetical protein